MHFSTYPNDFLTPCRICDETKLLDRETLKKRIDQNIDATIVNPTANPDWDSGFRAGLSFARYLLECEESPQ